MFWSEMLPTGDVRVCVVSIDVNCKHTSLQNVSMYTLSLGRLMSVWCLKGRKYVCQSVSGACKV